MKNFDIATALRWLALFLFLAAMIRMVYFTVAPALEYGFTAKPRPWFQVRFYLSQIVEAMFEPLLLLGVAELVRLRKETE